MRSARCSRCCPTRASPIVLLTATLAPRGPAADRSWRWAWCSAPTSAAACSAMLSTAQSTVPRCAACRWATCCSSCVGCLIAVPLLPRVAAAAAGRCCRRCAQQVVLFHLGFNVALARAVHRLHRRAGARCVERWLPAPPAPPGATRPQHLDPIGARHAVARHLVRGARGAAPGRRGRDHAARHAAGAAPQRPAAGRAAAQASTTRSTSCTRRSSST